MQEMRGELHALALSKGKIGERYILSGGGYEMKEIGKMTGKLSGKKVSTCSIW